MPFPGELTERATANIATKGYAACWSTRQRIVRVPTVAPQNQPPTDCVPKDKAAAAQPGKRSLEGRLDDVIFDEAIITAANTIRGVHDVTFECTTVAAFDPKGALATSVPYGLDLLHSIINSAERESRPTIRIHAAIAHGDVVVGATDSDRAWFTAKYANDREAVEINGDVINVNFDRGHSSSP